MHAINIFSVMAPTWHTLSPAASLLLSLLVPSPASTARRLIVPYDASDFIFRTETGPFANLFVAVMTQPGMYDDQRRIFRAPADWATFNFSDGIEFMLLNPCKILATPIASEDFIKFNAEERNAVYATWRSLLLDRRSLSKSSILFALAQLDEMTFRIVRGDGRFESPTAYFFVPARLAAFLSKLRNAYTVDDVLKNVHLYYENRPLHEQVLVKCLFGDVHPYCGRPEEYWSTWTTTAEELGLSPDRTPRAFEIFDAYRDYVLGLSSLDNAARDDSADTLAADSSYTVHFKPSGLGLQVAQCLRAVLNDIEGGAFDRLATREALRWALDRV